MTPAEAIEAAELTGAETRYRNQLAREMAEAAYERGHADGYVQAAADIKAVRHGIVLDAGLDARRWGPGGRRAFCGRAAGRLSRPRRQAAAGNLSLSWRPDD